MNYMLKTKIIVTNGPSLKSAKVLRYIVKNSDVIRFNFSHAKESEILDTIKKIKKVSSELKKDIAILGDLSGPKIRIKSLSGFDHVEKGDEVNILYSKKEAHSNAVSEKNIYLDYKLSDNIKKNNIIFYGDGELKFIVKGVYDDKIVAKAMNSSTVKIEKGINVFGSKVNLAPPTAADLRFLKFAVKHDFDFIAVSFVKSPENIKKIRRITKGIDIISKIETREAVDNIDGIIKESDGIMVARGDLGLHVGIEKLPIVQQYLLKKCSEYRKPIIIATQLLSSMKDNPFPTRAEANDIANNILDKADCVMLSNETAVGDYPIETVDTLKKIISNAESFIKNESDINRKELGINSIKVNKVNIAISVAAVDIAGKFKTDCIFAPTQTGATAKILSSLKSQSDIIALTNSEKVRKRLKLWYGVRTVPINKYETTNQMIENVKEIAKKERISRFIIVSGTPNKLGTTDTLKYIEMEKNKN